jgi:hypothetical protein
MRSKHFLLIGAIFKKLGENGEVFKRGLAEEGIEKFLVGVEDEEYLLDFVFFILELDSLCLEVK